MNSQLSTIHYLAFFAVKEEAQAFAAGGGVEVIVTGMGRRNAERGIRAALDKRRPELVLTCGFAGGLKPGLGTGTVLFETDFLQEITEKTEGREKTAGKGLGEFVKSPFPLLTPVITRLEAAGAVAGRFHCAERVATTAREKQALRAQTGADAVEMESAVIRAVCREQGVPCATVRVILDTAEEDLPLDFNALMTAEMKLDGRKLALALAKGPQKIPRLLKLQKQTKAAAKALGTVLKELTANKR